MLFALRLPGTLQFGSYAFSDTGANLTAQYLIQHGYRPTIDFEYPYGLLPLWLGRLWFGIVGLSPYACVALGLILGLLTAWGFVRLARNLRLNLAGILIILLTASLTIQSWFANIAHGMEPVFLVHALADQAGGNRRRALALAVTGLFVKPSMAYFFGFVLIVFLMFDWQRSPDRHLRELIPDMLPAAIATGVIAAILATSFGSVAVIHSLIPTEGLAMYRAAGYGFFGPAGRAFVAPRNVPSTYYCANIAGPWIVYTVVLIAAACFAMRDALADVAKRIDSTGEMIVTCALLQLSFIFFFFGNQWSWCYYFYILVIGLAAAARLGARWEFLVLLLAFAVPLTKFNKRIIQYVSSAHAGVPVDSRGPEAARPVIAALPVESSFTYQLWSSTAPSPVTAGLWATRGERAEWTRVLATVRGRKASVLQYYGCADLLSSEFTPPVTFFLFPGAVTANDVSRKLAQLKASAMVVIPRWSTGLLNEIPEIGSMVYRNFVPVYQGSLLIVYARRKSGD